MQRIRIEILLKKDEKTYKIEWCYFYRFKMPRSTFKMKFHSFNSGVGKCPYGQTFKFASERDQNMKLRLHLTFSSNPPESSKHIRAPKKAMMLREQQLNYAERMRRVHENH